MTTTGDIALALLEIDGVPSAYRARDEAQKQAPVTTLAFTPVSPGKVILIFTGAIACVEESLAAADNILGPRRIDLLFLPGIHPQALKVIGGKRTKLPEQSAMGIVECSTIASGVRAADSMVKGAAIQLLRLHLGSGFGGKAFIEFSGDVADVEAALDIATDHLGENLIDQELIPAPHPELLESGFVRPWSIDPANEL
ncbi:MAG: BMC domain-containing protein [Myxococcota bacterium]|nr:BMC domain-containing protein [Myxococcota bacterium]